MIRAQVLGVEAVVADLKAKHDGSAEKLRRAVQRLGLELLRKVKMDFLTGQALKVRTGRLRRSINESTENNGRSITSTVGTNVSYARFWELGFSGSENVRAHSRRIGQSGIVAQVRAHSRTVNQAARPFLRPALAEMSSRVTEQLTGAVNGL